MGPLFNITLVNRLLSWAYRYRLHCLFLNRPCSTSIPVDKIIETGKDIIQHGFFSDFAKKDSLLNKDYDINDWILHHNPINEKRYTPVKKTYLETMEFLEPQLSRSATLPEEFRKIIMTVSEYYLSSIKETEFSQLKVHLYDYSIDINRSFG